MKLFRFYLIALLVPLILCIGCAKDVGDDGVADIANGLNFAGEIVAEEGLIFIQKERPDLTPEVIENLKEIVATAKRYEDGKITASDFVATVNLALEKINKYTNTLDPDQAALIARNITRVTRLLDRHITEVTLPDEAGIYIQAFTTGIETGIDLFENRTPQEISLYIKREGKNL